MSYRRDDSKHAAGRLGERLGERFQLFMDIDSIRPGTDFTAVVRDAVDRADVVLAVIGKDWLFASSESGARRLDEPHDWVSLEVGTALKDGTPVIPVLVDGARMPDRGELPASLTDLASRQAISLDHESFAADCTRLIETIEGLVGSQESPDVDLWADPDYPTARSALLQGQWAKAAEGLERVLRRHPRHPQVQDQLAEARRRQNLADLD
ncbi:MAG TPA: TIR domain-containing protein, partial [Nocardioides sp.]|nr:TIR domain-containing protein [Nocardioides sp.]